MSPFAVSPYGTRNSEIFYMYESIMYSYVTYEVHSVRVHRAASRHHIITILLYNRPSLYGNTRQHYFIIYIIVMSHIVYIIVLVEKRSKYVVVLSLWDVMFDGSIYSTTVTVVL